MLSLTQKDVERFWGKIDKEKSEKFYNGTQCWEWTDFCNPLGYGMIHIGGRRGKTYLAHRVSWTIIFGNIPEGLLVLHHCDNPSCCNPRHLFLGTDKDNSDDKVSKGRQAINRGEKSGSHKLSDKQVSEIRRRYGWWGRGGESSLELAKHFGVSKRQILNIVRYKSRI